MGHLEGKLFQWRGVLGCKEGGGFSICLKMILCPALMK